MSNLFGSDSNVGMFPSEPLRFTREEAERLLQWCYEKDISDITLKTGEPVFTRAQGRLNRVTHRPLTTPEIGMLMCDIYGANATAILGSAEAIDTSFELKPDRFTRIRFRVNASPITCDGGVGYEVSLRTIKSMPVELANLGIEPVIIDNFFPAMGMVAVTGETGSGKSTLLSAMIRWKVEQANQHLKILTGEAPIEYVYDDCEKPDSVVSQSEIPKNFKCFSDFTRAAMRRDPNVILVGESRDPETMAASIEAAMTGHLLLTTLHSNGVASTMRRMVSLFPESERNGRSIDVIENLKMVVTQRLLKTVDDRRTAVREYLVFDDDVRRILLNTSLDKIPAKCRELTMERGRTLEAHAKEKLDAGIISLDEYTILASKQLAAEKEGF